MDRTEEPKLAGDRLNILLLTYLSILQYIPVCMSEAISLILQKRNVSYADQAEFSLATDPNCYHLLWAPIVDCVYSKRLGRRKTWIIPTQFLIGICLLYVSLNMDDWLGSEDGTRKPQLQMFSIVFFLCLFFASWQGIAVSGWSLTMLKQRNVGHASTCDNIGYAISQFLGFTLFLVLQSKDISNILRLGSSADHGFVSFSGFLLIWAIIFIVTTTMLLVLKKETDHTTTEQHREYRLGLKESYAVLWQIIKIAPVREICLILLTYEVGFAPVNGVANLKLMDAGVRSDTFALMTALSLPFQILLPFGFGRYLVGHRAMRTYVTTYVLKLIFGIVYAVFIYFTPFVQDEEGGLPYWHYWLLSIIYNANELIELFMLIAIWAFFSRISDSRFGGMYVTLFGSVASIGYRWPISFCLWLVDFLTIRSCSNSEPNGVEKCVVILDGFFTEMVVGSVFAVWWLCWARKKIYKLEDMESSEWLVE